MTATVVLGSVTVPVKVGPARFAFKLSAVVTNAVVATAVVLFAADCVTAMVPVGRVGVPVKVGEAKLAFRLSAVVTNAVVANAVVLFPATCVVPIVPVGSVGVPVNVGDAKFAFSASAVNTVAWLGDEVVTPFVIVLATIDVISRVSTFPDASLVNNNVFVLSDGNAFVILKLTEFNSMSVRAVINALPSDVATKEEFSVVVEASVELPDILKFPTALPDTSYVTTEKALGVIEKLQYGVV